MNREIKFRAWANKTNEMIDLKQITPLALCDGILDEGDGLFIPFRDDIILMQYTGLKDKKGVEIYEGDIIRWREAFRSYDVQYGDAMPNNRCAFPMEPEIRTCEYPVIFQDCSFGCITTSHYEDYESEDFTNLNWCGQVYDTENDVKQSVAYGRNSDDMWSIPETKEGDLEYLLETYNLKDVVELLSFLSGIEVIGNIYQNPELLTNP